jgi:hypothetical protein
MRTVYKYELEVRDGIQFVTVPRGAKFLHLDHQGNPLRISLWFEVDTDEFLVHDREFQVFGTGHSLPQIGWDYRGTTIHLTVGLVWHVYERVYS